MRIKIKNINCGITGYFWILAIIILIALNLSNTFSVSWYLILAPLWVPIFMFLLMTVSIVMLLLIASIIFTILQLYRRITHG